MKSMKFWDENFSLVHKIVQLISKIKEKRSEEKHYTSSSLFEF